MRTVKVLTNNPALYRRIDLILRGVATTLQAETEGGALSDLTVIDPVSFPEATGGIILPRGPISHEWLIGAVAGTELPEGKRIAVRPAYREVSVDGRSAVLTEVEFRLFSTLFSREGFISRAELKHEVWGDGRDEGVVNVYIHYLREKLEAGGERVIVSSRREGYKIDERYERRTVC